MILVCTAFLLFAWATNGIAQQCEAETILNLLQTRLTHSRSHRASTTVKQPPLSAAIVEARSHSALPLVIANMLVNMPDTPIQVFYGIHNTRFVHDLLPPVAAAFGAHGKAAATALVEKQVLSAGASTQKRWGKTSEGWPALTLEKIPERFFATQLNRTTYTTLLESPEFWDSVLGERVLIFQTDSWVCNNARAKIQKFLQYDYIGAPWGTGTVCKAAVGNGGFSLRSKRIMRELTSQYKGKAKLALLQQPPPLAAQTADEGAALDRKAAFVKFTPQSADQKNMMHLSRNGHGFRPNPPRKKWNPKDVLEEDQWFCVEMENKNLRKDKVFSWNYSLSQLQPIQPSPASQTPTGSISTGGFLEKTFTLGSHGRFRIRYYPHGQFAETPIRNNYRDASVYVTAEDKDSFLSLRLKFGRDMYAIPADGPALFKVGQAVGRHDVKPPEFSWNFNTNMPVDVWLYQPVVWARVANASVARSFAVENPEFHSISELDTVLGLHQTWKFLGNTGTKEEALNRTCPGYHLLGKHGDKNNFEPPDAHWWFASQKLLEDYRKLLAERRVRQAVDT